MVQAWHSTSTDREKADPNFSRAGSSTRQASSHLCGIPYQITVDRLSPITKTHPLSPGNTPTVTWQHAHCHLATYPFSPGNTPTVTWQHAHCHLATCPLSPGNMPTVTWQHPHSHLATHPLAPGNTPTLVNIFKYLIVVCMYVCAGVVSRVWGKRCIGAVMQEPAHKDTGNWGRGGGV